VTGQRPSDTTRWEGTVSTRSGGLDLPTAGPEREGFLGRHAIVGHLGAGGMGEVLCVRDPDLGRDVAAKVLRDAHDPAARAKFEREAAITGRLEHPGIIPLYELGRRTGDGGPYFTMRRVSGVDLDQLLLAPDPPAPSELLAIFAKVCEAVAYAHDQGVVHRDLKPANVMTGAYGEVYVLDWGLAKRAGEADPTPVPAESTDGVSLATREGTIMGTPAYMPPEQAEGRVADVGPQSDVYSLGAILYQMLCGQPPYTGASAWAVIGEILDGPPPPPSVRAPDRSIPSELLAIVAKAMSRAPSDRYATALALKADVEAFLAGRFVKAARYGVVATVRMWARAHSLAVRVAAAVLVTAGTVAGGFSWQVTAARNAVRAAALAEREGRLAAARERVRSTDPTRLVGAARAVFLDPDPARRAPPSAGELTELAGLGARLQEAASALSALHALDTTDELVRHGWSAVLCALGRVAEARLEDGLAQLAYAQAASLGDDEASELARRAADAPAARLARRAARIDLRLAEARAGELEYDLAYLRAVAELASYRDRQTVERLVAVLDDGARCLVGAAKDALVEAASEPGELGGAIDWWLDPAGAAIDPVAMRRILRAKAELERRASAQAGVPVGPTAALAARQRAALGVGGARCARLAAEVLALLGDDPVVVAALARFVWASFDESQAAVAGAALAHLAGGSPDASRVVLRSVGLGDSSEAPRFAMTGTYWRQVERELGGAALPDATNDATSSTAEAWVSRGVVHAAAGQLQQALAAFDRALALEPGRADALDRRGVVRLALGDHAGALADLQRAVEYAPRNGQFRSNLGRARQLQGDLPGAIAEYDRALAEDDRLAIAYLNRGVVRAAMGEFGAALQDYDRALAIDPEDGGVYAARGLARQHVGDLDGALADFEKALTIDPRQASAHLARGTLRQQRGDRVGALADYERTLALDPRNAVAYQNRGSLRRNEGDLHGALADYDRAIELAPLRWPSHFNRGVVLSKLGRTADARAALLRARELAPPEARRQVDGALGRLDGAGSGS